MCAVRPHAAAASRLRCAGVSETRYDIPETTWPGRMRIGVANPDISCAVMQRPAAVRGDVSAGLGQLTRRGPCPAAKRGGRGARVSPRTTRKRENARTRHVSFPHTRRPPRWLQIGALVAWPSGPQRSSHCAPPGLRGTCYVARFGSRS